MLDKAVSPKKCGVADMGNGKLPCGADRFLGFAVNEKKDSMGYSKNDSMTKMGPVTDQILVKKDSFGEKAEIESNSGIKHSVTENLSNMNGFFSQTQSNLVGGP